MDRTVQFEQAVADWVARNGLIVSGGRLLLAVSGGIDSMAMLNVLFRLKKTGQIDAELAVAHVNHQLRGADSEADCRFVQEQAKQRGLAFFSYTVDAAAYARQNRLSIETSARVLRLRHLAQMARCWRADAVAAAHHRDDQVETLVFRLLRGTGLRGLCGIKPTAFLEGVRFIRPMLAFSRSQIAAYCRDRRLLWQEDATNSDCTFARNRIRRLLLPALRRTAAGDIDALLEELARNCQSLFKRIDARTEDLWSSAVHFESPEEIVLDRTLLRGACPLILGEIFHRGLLGLKAGLRDYTRRHYRRLMDEMYQPTKKCFSLPAKIECLSGETLLILRKKQEVPPTGWEPVILEPGQPCRFGPWQVRAVLSEGGGWEKTAFKGPDCWMETFDAEKICGPIRIRMRKPADRFVPLGMNQSKKVGKFLSAAKIDSKLRRQTFIMEDTQKILWVAPVRISEEAKRTAQTVRVLQVSIWK